MSLLSVYAFHPSAFHARGCFWSSEQDLSKLTVTSLFTEIGAIMNDVQKVREEEKPGSSTNTPRNLKEVNYMTIKIEKGEIKNKWEKGATAATGDRITEEEIEEIDEN